MSALRLLLFAALAISPLLAAQTPSDQGPIAIVPFDTTNSGAKVTGSLEVSQGKAVIASNGEITSGSQTTQVALPRRGTLRVCAASTIDLTVDRNVASGQAPSLMMALGHGAVEASFATSRSSDVLITPAFSILLGGPGPVDVKVRLGEGGDTCVENLGSGSPFVLVSSVFDNRAYRVLSGQRVMFQHGSITQVVDQEKEPCGCPPPAPATPAGNEFPLAQSEGLAPLPKVAPAPPITATNRAQTAPPLTHNAPDSAAQPLPEVQPASEPAPPVSAAPPAKTKSAPAKRNGLLHRLRNFFRALFGAE